MDNYDGCYFPNKLGRIVLLAFEEVMGKNGLNSILNLSGLSFLIDNLPSVDDESAIPFEIFGRLQSSMEKGYGPHGGRGLALRAGRVFFTSGLRAYGLELGLNDTDFRLQPPELKLMSVLHTMTDFFNEQTNQAITVEESDHKILWQVGQCPWCWGRHEFEPVCQFAVGILQEALYWISGGKFYNVAEETCVAQGDRACLFMIDRVPLS